MFTHFNQLITKTMNCMTFSKLLPLFLYIICDSVSIGSQYNYNLLKCRFCINDEQKSL